MIRASLFWQRAVPLLKNEEHRISVKCYLFNKCSAAESATKQKPKQQKKRLDRRNSITSPPSCFLSSWPYFKNPNLEIKTFHHSKTNTQENSPACLDYSYQVSLEYRAQKHTPEYALFSLSIFSSFQFLFSSGTNVTRQQIRHLPALLFWAQISPKAYHGNLCNYSSSDSLSFKG